jgi:hypothetical protein
MVGVSDQSEFEGWIGIDRSLSRFLSPFSAAAGYRPGIFLPQACHVSGASRVLSMKS